MPIELKRFFGVTQVEIWEKQMLRESGVQKFYWEVTLVKRKREENGIGQGELSKAVSDADMTASARPLESSIARIVH